MKADTPCLLYSEDAGLARRVGAFLESTVTTRHIDTGKILKRELESADPALILMDLRSTASCELLGEIQHLWPDTLIIALGTRRSDPALRAEAMGVYGFQEIDFEGRQLQSLVNQSLAHIRLVEQLRLLRSAPASHPDRHVDPARDDRRKSSDLLSRFFPPLRHFEDRKELVQGIIDSVANSAIVLRAGIFTRDRDTGVYTVESEVGCREETRSTRFEADHSLVRWLETRAQIVSRSRLHYVERISERMMLQRALDSMGAELIVPLQGRRNVIGWLFMGQQATGTPFTAADLKDIMVFAEHASMAIENAMLYEEVVLQKTFAEIVLGEIPTAIAAAAPDGRIRWYDDAAERILGIPRDAVLNRPAEKLGSYLADILNNALREGKVTEEPQEWTEPLSKRHLSVQSSLLENGGKCLGAVLFIKDLTRERMLNRKQQELERASFWTDLAASMSHQVRNPLVAIKTFAQLLPERYNDPQFRTEFSSLMSQEVDRLNGIIEQINKFANLPAPSFEIIDLNSILEKSIDMAKQRTDMNGIKIRTVIPAGLPAIYGDTCALSECFSHIIENSIEALAGREDPKIWVEAQTKGSCDSEQKVCVTVCDNAEGMPAEIIDKVFSPFCTTKRGGMGLGLPIAKRTVTDHNGQIDLDSSEKGTSVSVTLPADRDRGGRTE
jgi:nitrogen-specific signal transduction histidine kinase